MVLKRSISKRGTFLNYASLFSFWLPVSCTNSSIWNKKKHTHSPLIFAVKLVHIDVPSSFLSFRFRVDHNFIHIFRFFENWTRFKPPGIHNYTVLYMFICFSIINKNVVFPIFISFFKFMQVYVWLNPEQNSFGVLLQDESRISIWVHKKWWVHFKN